MVQHHCCLPFQYNHNGKPSQPALEEIGVMQDYLLPLAKVRDGEGHLGNLVAQKIQSKATLDGRSGLLLMVLAPTEHTAGHQSHSGHKPPLCPMRGRQQGCPRLPCPLFPGEDHSSPLCHSPSLVAGPCVQPCHFTFRWERGGRNVHYRW